MGLVGRVVKLAGSGVGLGREAYLHHQEKKEAARRASPNPQWEDQSMHQGSSFADDDVYVHLPEEHAQDLIARGEAYPVPEERQRDLKHIDEDDISDSEDSVYLEDDWEADEEADLPPPSYDSLYDVAPTPVDVKGRQPQSLPQDNLPSASRDEPQSSQQGGKDVTKYVEQVLASAGPIPTHRSPLQYPVIIPQRRPGAKSRGFVRGYAPDLAASGISQDTFMTFLHNFDESAKASPYLQALFISAGIVGFVPGVIPMAVSTAVQIASGTAIELQSRYKANSYLERINRDLFMPRGLYAMIMRYKPQAQTPNGQMDFGFGEVNLDTTKSVARWAPGQEMPNSGMKIMKQIRLSSGTSKGESDMPVMCAPLIFPTADGGAKLETSREPAGSVGGPSSGADERTFKEKVKSAYEFVNDYYDRRAQAEYLNANPNTALGGQAAAPQFRSRYADPTNASNNSLFGLLSGGAIEHQRPSRKERKAFKQERKNARRVARGKAPRPPRGQRKPHGPAGYLIKGIKKVLHEDILYLMVVEMPSQQELDEARRMLSANGWK